MAQKKVSVLYRIIKWTVRAVYPEIEVCGGENLPGEGAVIVGNHSQMNGPIASELYIPGEHYTWCAGQMMHLKDVPEYAFQDFWSGKPWYSRWFYRILSYCIAPLSVCVFNNANTIGVYHDTRILSTFKTTVAKLQEGARVVIFPERNEPYNHILYQFQDRFIDVAKLYYKRTGKCLSFVPMYLTPKLKKMYFGEPVSFCPDNPMEAERSRIRDCLMERITAMAESAPAHTVIPYPNIPRRRYPRNKVQEADYEKTGG